jgi:hypothetical protein
MMEDSEAIRIFEKIIRKTQDALVGVPRCASDRDRVAVVVNSFRIDRVDGARILRKIAGR